MSRTLILMLLITAYAVPCEARWRRRHKCRIQNECLSSQAHRIASAATDKRVIYPQIAKIRTEWLDIDNTWKAYADDEAVWADEKNRYVCILEPADYSQVQLIRFLKRPYEDPKALWTEFGRAEMGHNSTPANLGVGNWLISVEIHFTDGAVHSLHDKK